MRYPTGRRNEFGSLTSIGRRACSAGLRVPHLTGDLPKRSSGMRRAKRVDESPAHGSPASSTTSCAGESASTKRQLEARHLARRNAATMLSPGRARWGASGSLNPQSALAGLNPLPRGSRPRHGHRVRALTVKSRALGVSEPRQVREEAALRSASQVPRANLTRASARRTGSNPLSKEGAWPGSRIGSGRR